MAKRKQPGKPKKGWVLTIGDIRRNPDLMAMPDDTVMLLETPGGPRPLVAVAAGPVMDIRDRKTVPALVFGLGREDGMLVFTGPGEEVKH